MKTLLIASCLAVILCYAVASGLPRYGAWKDQRDLGRRVQRYTDELTQMKPDAPLSYQTVISGLTEAAAEGEVYQLSTAPDGSQQVTSVRLHTPASDELFTGSNHYACYQITVILDGRGDVEVRHIRPHDDGPGACRDISDTPVVA